MRIIRAGKRKNKQTAVLLLLAVAVILVIGIILICSLGKTRTFYLTGGNTAYHIDEEEAVLPGEPLMCNNTAYIPAEDILRQCGYTLSWDAERYAIVLTKKRKTSYLYVNDSRVDVNGEEKHFENPTIMRDNILYMPVEMFRELSKDEIYIDGTLKAIRIPVRDLMQDTQIDDSYRINGSIEEYNGLYLVDGRVGIEGVSYPEENCIAYAEVVNALAKAVPEAKTYDIAVPTISEFYAPRELYADQISGIRRIYELLDPEIMPVNVVKEMWQHADEKLYFYTDHHWTQRGAYYAYKAFLNTLEDEETIADLSAFPLDIPDTFHGSWLNETAGTPGEDQLRANPEELERFLPIVDTSGGMYTDMYMQESYGPSVVVNTDDNSYTSFICGDQPLTHFHTNNPNGKSVLLIKDSFGNAFATWLINNYTDVYVVDPRDWNGFNHKENEFKLRTFYDEVAQFDDLIILSYPGSAASSIRQAIYAMVQ